MLTMAEKEFSSFKEKSLAFYRRNQLSILAKDVVYEPHTYTSFITETSKTVQEYVQSLGSDTTMTLFVPNDNIVGLAGEDIETVMTNLNRLGITFDRTYRDDNGSYQTFIIPGHLQVYTGNLIADAVNIEVPGSELSFKKVNQAVDALYICDDKGNIRFVMQSFHEIGKDTYHEVLFPTRYGAFCVSVEDNDHTLHQRIFFTDNGEIMDIKILEELRLPYQQDKVLSQEELQQKAEDILAMSFPDWKDPFAYRD